MNKKMATMVIIMCIAGAGAAFTLAFLQPPSPREEGQGHANPIEAQIQRVTERVSSNALISGEPGSWDLSVSEDIENDWEKYRASSENGPSLQSIISGAAQPHVPHVTRINLAKSMLDLQGTSEEEAIKRVKAVIDIAESVESPEMGGLILQEYAHLPVHVKPIVIARLAISDTPGFLELAGQCANLTNLNDPQEITSLNEGIEIVSDLDRVVTVKLIGALKAEIRKLVTVSTKE